MNKTSTSSNSKQSEREICGLVSELNHVIETHLRQGVHGLELTPSQAVALRELGEPLTLRELAGRMCCEPSNASYVADRLVDLNWVRRDEHPTDRRAKVLSLTPAGQAKRDLLVERLGEGSPLKKLADVEQTQLRTLLQKAVGAWIS